MRSVTRMEVAEVATELVSKFIESDANDVKALFRYCKTPKYGEIFASREIATAVAKKVALVGCKPEDMLSSPHNTYFNKVTVNPQGHLCLHLNRPVVFCKCIGLLTSYKADYGRSPLGSHDCACTPPIPTTPPVPVSIHLMNHTSFSNDRSTNSVDCTNAESIPATCSVQTHVQNESRKSEAFQKTTPYSEPSLDEARVIMITGLLRNVLQTRGQSVSQSGNHLSEAEIRDPGGDDSLWHLLQPFLKSEDGELSSLFSHELTLEEFLSSLRPFRSKEETTSFVIDVKKPLKKAGAIGKGGYDSNLEKVEVCDAAGQITGVASIAFKIAKLHRCIAEGDHMIIHVTWQRNSFIVQQAMALADISSRASRNPIRQCILLLADVHCFVDGKPAKRNNISELLRLKQMTDAYVIKYGEKAKGTQLQDLARRMTEAVVKFELLSSDPKATVKVELPSLSQSDVTEANSDVRFSGTFVLYNYARLGTLFIHFSQACQQGIYPPLPAIENVDFSLLKDELEWELFFHYVLQYPVVVKEAAELKCRGIGIRLEVALKKVCMFLTKLSHAFSSYYSRVKILLPPEPHLIPLVHARLYLMSAIKQVMLNALTLLEIEPVDQL